MSAVDPNSMINHMLERGVKQETLDVINFAGMDLKEWLRGFGDVKTSVLKSVDLIRRHPLIPAGVQPHGLCREDDLFSVIADTLGKLFVIRPDAGDHARRAAESHGPAQQAVEGFPGVGNKLQMYIPLRVYLMNQCF